MSAIFHSEHFTDIVMLAAALVLAGVQKLWRSYRLSRSQTWPLTHGTTLRSESEDGKLKVFYSYGVGESSFQGEFEKKFRDTSEAEWWAEALTKKQVAVHYDPNNPQRSELWESDLMPIVQSLPPAPVAHVQELFPAWERGLVRAGIAVSLAGCGLSLLAYFGNLAGKEWISPGFSTGLFVGGLAMAGLAALERKRVRRKRAAPEWMSFATHALLYFAILTSVLLPLDKARRRPAQSTLNLSYQVLFYFGAFETLYMRLKDEEENSFATVGSYLGK
ncbi:MAG TPA: DUF3592 domain-containing protein [Terriglobales bacterium]|nr:DUF3592 domain-containing protein [Terriglobales bacterium]